MHRRGSRSARCSPSSRIQPATVSSRPWLKKSFQCSATSPLAASVVLAELARLVPIAVTSMEVNHA
jgi:hypothetical protein